MKSLSKSILAFLFFPLISMGCASVDEGWLRLDVVDSKQKALMTCQNKGLRLITWSELSKAIERQPRKMPLKSASWVKEDGRNDGEFRFVICLDEWRQMEGEL